jgi:hypothetical protein
MKDADERSQIGQQIGRFQWIPVISSQDFALNGRRDIRRAMGNAVFTEGTLINCSARDIKSR